MVEPTPRIRDSVKWYLIFGMIVGGCWGWSTDSIDLGEQWVNGTVGLLAGGVWALLFVGSGLIANKILSWATVLIVGGTPGALISAVADGAVDGSYVFASLIAGFLLVVLAEKAIEEGA